MNGAICECGEVCYTRITNPYCPIHGSMPRPYTTDELVCAAADVWATDRMACRLADVFDAHPALAKALDKLEERTRSNPLRKVKP